MNAFHATIHAKPKVVTPGPCAVIGGRQVGTLRMPTEGLVAPFEVTFEAVSAAIEKFPGLFTEPDGAFVWRSPPGAEDWKLDGVLYDRNDRMLYVELKGTCSGAVLERFLTTLGWPAQQVVIQMAREGLLLEFAEFRSLIGV